MNIRQLIDSLEKKAELSNEGYQTEVKLNLHALEFNGSALLPNSKTYTARMFQIAEFSRLGL